MQLKKQSIYRINPIFYVLINYLASNFFIIISLLIPTSFVRESRTQNINHKNKDVHPYIFIFSNYSIFILL